MVKINRLIDHDALEDEELSTLAPYLCIMGSGKSSIIKESWGINKDVVLLDFPSTCLNLMLFKKENNSAVSDIRSIADTEIKKVLIFSFQYLNRFSNQTLNIEGLRNIIGLSPFSYPLHFNNCSEYFSKEVDQEFKVLFEEVPVKLIYQNYIKSKQ